MAALYVARSANICQWASDVGLGKNIFKVGVCDGDPAALLAKGMAGETDWKLLKQVETDLDESAVLERLAKRQKQVDPTYYPRIKGELGLYKLTDNDVQRHIVLARALEGESERAPIRLKPVDYANYLISNALR
ncbi:MULTISPECIES: hypothetical protein [unclassified Azospirillum]|uniref:hypothetical protein n=1 Tax=unclassified Azospirillum TaxID=2630922 RepID=UPI000B630616|nr:MULTISPECIES: hypothetical protein [unclassified Azospirillum]SNS49008.1 hypothetical protein SAMN05880556_105199 [Azospirillum sp. RU38E]SNS68157.1 hypothetical protein SAMN05880591_105199 [Azospirillum sp. RU37A]